MIKINTHSYYNKYKRNKDSSKFYKSAKWSKVREMALKRDNYLCQSCLSKKKIQKAELVHHLKELIDHPELGAELDNLISWCNSCHNSHHKISKKTDTENKIKVSNKINLVVSKPNPEIF